MDYYNYFLIVHIIAVIAWMAALFYLPRLYVYHIENINKKDFVDVVKVQERKLYRAIAMPAMIVAVLAGAGMLVISPEMFLSGPWLHAKLFIALLLIIYTFSLGHYKNDLAKGICKRSSKFFRAYNEIPTLAMILIVFYVVTKSFSLLFTLLMIIIFMIILFTIYKKAKEYKA